MNEKLITALLAILLALGGWTLQRTFSLSQDMVLIKTKVEMIENEISQFKDSKGKKNRKKKKMSKSSNCHHGCHCDGDLHADEYGVCTCENCECKSKAEDKSYEDEVKYDG